MPRRRYIEEQVTKTRAYGDSQHELSWEKIVNAPELDVLEDESTVSVLFHPQIRKEPVHFCRSVKSGFTWCFSCVFQGEFGPRGEGRKSPSSVKTPQDDELVSSRDSHQSSASHFNLIVVNTNLRHPAIFISPSL